MESRKLLNSSTYTSPFSCYDEWCTTEIKYVYFPKDVIIGTTNEYCAYREAILSIDVAGENCSSSNGSITCISFNVAAIDIAVSLYMDTK